MPKRVDSNQREIVSAFRSRGISVFHLHEVGRGCPDLLLGFKGHNYLVEIKDGSKSLSRQKLTPQEEEFFKNWQGHARIVKSVSDALEFANLIGA